MAIGPNEAVIVNTHTGAQTKVRLDQLGAVDAGITQIGSGDHRDEIKNMLAARTGGQFPQAAGAQAAPPVGPAAALAAAPIAVQAPAPLAADKAMLTGPGQQATLGLPGVDGGSIQDILVQLRDVIDQLKGLVEKLGAAMEGGIKAG